MHYSHASELQPPAVPCCGPGSAEGAAKEPIHAAIVGALALSPSQTTPNKPLAEAGLLKSWKHAVLQSWKKLFKMAPEMFPYLLVTDYSFVF